MKRAHATFILLLAAMSWGPPAAAQGPALQRTCPLASPQTEAAKSNTLYLYFPTRIDYRFSWGAPVGPFDAATLSQAFTSKDTPALIDRIRTVVADDYCEFNVQVQNTTSNPDDPSANPSPPPYHSTVAIGADVDRYGRPLWGQSPPQPSLHVATNPGHARVWAGYYSQCEGGSYANGVVGKTCPATSELKGSNATVERWAQAIGGTAAHEAGHTYGLVHADEDLPSFPDEPYPPSPPPPPQPPPPPDQDLYYQHLMPEGEYISAHDRVSYRRHFGDGTYGILATNVGLTMETMHNWDLQNPNQATGYSLTIDFLSKASSLNIDWSFGGPESPWTSPVVTNLNTTTTFQNDTYNNYRITWSNANPAYGTAGQVPGGGRFHVGTTFTGVDFNQPNAIIVGKVTLYDANGNPLGLHPRLPMYDAGVTDVGTNAPGTKFLLNVYAPKQGAALRLQKARIYQLPRVASIESMIGDGHPASFDGEPIKPWGVTECRSGSLRGGLHCVLADRDDPPHVQVRHRLGDPGVIDCSRPLTPPDSRDPARYRDLLRQGRQPPPETAAEPAGPKDSPFAPDREGAVCAGTQRDPFPSTTVYMIATFVDPKARHYDPQRRKYVVGPVSSQVFYQFAGVRDREKLWKSKPGPVRCKDRDNDHDRDDRDCDCERDDDRRHRRHRR